MAQPEHLAKLKKGVDAWNTWRYKTPGVKPDLAGVNLRMAALSKVNFAGVNFAGADLYRADLSEAILGKAHLVDANLSWANLTDSDLNSVNLTGALLTRAKLHKANLSGAKLHMADFHMADLSGANLSGAHLSQMSLANTDLTETKGLESCVHSAPSSVGIDTFFRAHGTIPDSFLRGCGVPEQFITYARSLVASPIEFYSCFISYSSKDQEFAYRLHADLRAKDLRVWFAPEDLKIGDRFQERIEESIRLFDKVMIVLSDASVQSRWVEREVNAAREREDRENRPVLFPIRIDGAVMDAIAPWAADLRRQRHIGDFSCWKNHDTYKDAFTRLMRDLQAKAPMQQ